eukprot:s613_g5.t2
MELQRGAWTDRILFRSKTSAAITVGQYSVHSGLKQSDHRLVFASLRAPSDDQISGKRRQRPTAFGQATSLEIEPQEVSFKAAKPDVSMHHTAKLILKCSSGLLRQRFEVFFETSLGDTLSLVGCLQMSWVKDKGCAVAASPRWNATWWGFWVVCITVEDVDEKGEETELERYFKYKDQEDQWVKTTLLRLACPPDRVVSSQLNRLITGFTEFRQDWSHLPRGWLTYHSFNFIHVQGGELTICLEKKTDKLEIMLATGPRATNFMQAEQQDLELWGAPLTLTGAFDRAMGAVGSRKSTVNRYVENLEDSPTGPTATTVSIASLVEQYMERQGHRKYEVRCALRLPESATPVTHKKELQVDALFDVLPLTWSCWKRLYELREDLYEPVKDCLGASYDKHFKNAPFALRIGISGTLERLDLWVQRLGELVSEKLLPGRCLALILRFLDAPAPEEAEDGTLRPKANFGSEKCLTHGDREFRIREWRSNWQLELKTRLLNLGAQPQVWERHVVLCDDAGEKLLAKCREDVMSGNSSMTCVRFTLGLEQDGYPYVTYSNSSLKGQPIHFPVTVTVDACVLADRWAEPAECVDFSALIRPRNPDRCSAMSHRQCAAGITVARLFEWIDGPLARGWQPYSLMGSNCQHFAEELHDFLLNPGKVEENLHIQDLPDFLHTVEVQVKHNPKVLLNLPPQVSKERAIALTAVRTNGLSLEFLEEQFRQDWRVVMAAVQQDGSALEFASEELKKDRQVVLAAVENKGSALKLAHSSLHRDRQLLVAAGWHAPGVFVSTWSSEADSSPRARSAKSAVTSKGEPTTPSANFFPRSPVNS